MSRSELWESAGGPQPFPALPPTGITTLPGPRAIRRSLFRSFGGPSRIRTCVVVYLIYSQALSSAQAPTQDSYGAPDRIRTGVLLFDRQLCLATTPRKRMGVAFHARSHRAYVATETSTPVVPGRTRNARSRMAGVSAYLWTVSPRGRFRHPAWCPLRDSNPPFSRCERDALPLDQAGLSDRGCDPLPTAAGATRHGSRCRTRTDDFGLIRTALSL